ncbi:hypothetical protein GQ55_8G259400 [Panicum hallii var. hallii]|uniref:Uncharacterized protein n=1 Tax=Panicum hallii var. hallii TaxID=1504633 RepID=A0A2T7CRC1_9POAL|nr:hypothetical protein GQ55_8G259400 [Panicum hallii var. hallii]
MLGEARQGAVGAVADLAVGHGGSSPITTTGALEPLHGFLVLDTSCRGGWRCKTTLVGTSGCSRVRPSNTVWRPNCSIWQLVSQFGFSGACPRHRGGCR